MLDGRQKDPMQQGRQGSSDGLSAKQTPLPASEPKVKLVLPTQLWAPARLRPVEAQLSRGNPKAALGDSNPLERFSVDNRRREILDWPEDTKTQAHKLSPDALRSPSILNGRGRG
jgi:hypothetical protein